jgi:bifunctional non-homologous end joining protein LigD
MLTRLKDTGEGSRDREEGKKLFMDVLNGTAVTGPPSSHPGSPGMPDDRLSAYRAKRRQADTPEPVPEQGPLPQGNDNTFVIQEHHARRLHWDFRLERDGVLVSWALPRGLPADRRTNRLAIRTENHPLQYASFEGEIPPGQYGAGTVRIWDSGTYETEKWTDDEIKIVMHGSRVAGRYVLIHIQNSRWLVHRMDRPGPGSARPAEAGRASQPDDSPPGDNDSHACKS